MEQFYRELAYPVWQFAKDTGIDKTLTEAFKYLVRYLDKNQEEDKNKAIEYISTLRSKDEYFPCNWYNIENLKFITPFLEQFDKKQKPVLRNLLDGHYKDVLEYLNPEIFEQKNQEKEYLTHACTAC